MDQITEPQKTQAPAKPKSRKNYAIAAVAIVVLLAVAYLAVSYFANPVAAAGDIVNVTYTGSFTNGTVFGTNVGGQPLQFTVGSNQLIKGFDDAVIGMHVNQEKTVTLPVNEAYGPVNPNLIINIPSNSFGNQTAQIGMGVTTVFEGQELQGTIIAINSNTVTANFNPLLAGKVLIFKIKVLSVKGG